MKCNVLETRCAKPAFSHYILGLILELELELVCGSHLDLGRAPYSFYGVKILT